MSEGEDPFSETEPATENMPSSQESYFDISEFSQMNRFEERQDEVKEEAEDAPFAQGSMV